MAEESAQPQPPQAVIHGQAQMGLFVRPCGRVALVVRGDRHAWDQAVQGARLLLDVRGHTSEQVGRSREAYLHFLADDGDPEVEPRFLGRSAFFMPKAAEVVLVLLAMQGNIDFFVHGEDGSMLMMAFLRRSPWEYAARKMSPLGKP